MMRIAVAGATGHIGSLTVTALEVAGHSVVRISRAHGVDLVTGDRLDDALAGVEAVVDTTNSNATDTHEAVAYLGTLTRNLLAAEQRAAVRHHVLLSIVGIDHVDGNAALRRQTRARAPRRRGISAMDDRARHTVP